MVITRSAVATVSAADAAAVMPAATAATTASLLVSNAFTGKPFFTRFLAMGNPMVPTPMKPIRFMTRLLVPCESGGECRGRRSDRRPAVRLVYYPGHAPRSPVHRARGDLMGHHRRDDDGA